MSASIHLRRRATDTHEDTHEGAHETVSLAANVRMSSGFDVWTVSALMLVGACCCTAVAVVYTKHLSRAAWAEISASRSVIDNLSVEWSRLQIEESTFSDHGRVERAASDRLGMVYPDFADARLIVREASDR